MSRASVLRDQAIALGESDRAGAVAVLAELWALDPELMGEAMGRALLDELSIKHTLIAGPWRKLEGEPETWQRTDLCRRVLVGFVSAGRSITSGRWMYAASWYPEASRHYSLGDFTSVENARAAVDRALTNSATHLPWRLL